jgi:phosphatidylglycerophosphatase A
MANPDPRSQVWRDPVHWLAFGLGAGTVPVAPGTFGTLVAIPVYLLLRGWPLWFYVAVTAVLFCLGVWLCGRTARELGVHDHPGIVWDEIVGLLVTMTGAPAGWTWLAAGFVAFRFFDILKPWPIRWLDRRVEGGIGIMLDDVGAGIYAALILQLGHLLATAAG